MMRNIVFRNAAREDVIHAHDWYEQQRTGLGDRFDIALDETLKSIVALPESFPVVH